MSFLWTITSSTGGGRILSGPTGSGSKIVSFWGGGLSGLQEKVESRSDR
jgi:hypothetical protein